MQYRKNISTRLSSNSEAFASDLLDNLEEPFLRFWNSHEHQKYVFEEICGGGCLQIFPLTKRLTLIDRLIVMATSLTNNILEIFFPRIFQKISSIRFRISKENVCRSCLCLKVHQFCCRRFGLEGLDLLYSTMNGVPGECSTMSGVPGEYSTMNRVPGERVSNLFNNIMLVGELV